MQHLRPISIRSAFRPVVFLLFLLLVSCGYEPLEQAEEIEYSPFCSPINSNVTDDHFWFVQITDIEQTRCSGAEFFGFSIRDRYDYDTFLHHLRYIRNYVNPAFIVATGDLVYGGILEQVPEQWLDYRNAVRAACFDQSNFHDVPGNHDVLYVDNYAFYLKYSISQEIHHDWTIENSAGRFAFAATNTSRPGYHEGYFRKDEEVWLTEILNDYQDYDYRILFAHHNLPWDERSRLFAPDGVLRNRRVNGFFGGHVHEDGEQNQDGILNVQTRAMYDTMTRDIDGAFRIVSFDGLAFASASKYILNHGPQVMVTSPQDRSYTTSANPDGHVVTGKTRIRALAFYTEEAPDLAVYIDNHGPYTMEPVDDNRYEVEIDFNQVEPGLHIIRVLAPGYNDKINPVDAITVEVP